MKRTNYLQHLTLENTYVKYRYNELLVSHTKLQSEISDLNRKLDQLYKNHANTVIILQEKNHHFSQLIEEKSQHIRTLLFDDDGKSGRFVEPLSGVTNHRFSGDNSFQELSQKSELTFSH